MKVLGVWNIIGDIDDFYSCIASTVIYSTTVVCQIDHFLEWAIREYYRSIMDGKNIIFKSFISINITVHITHHYIFKYRWWYDSIGCFYDWNRIKTYINKKLILTDTNWYCCRIIPAYRGSLSWRSLMNHSLLPTLIVLLLCNQNCNPIHSETAKRHA